MRKLAQRLVQHAALFLVVFMLTWGLQALAQTPAGLYGYDTITLPDGGIVRKVQVDSSGRLVLSPSGVVSIIPASCASTSVNGTTSVGVASTSVPAAALAARYYVQVCNSPQNTGTPLVKCRADGTAPTMAIGNAGDVMEVGDCITYPIAAAITLRCISDTATTYVTTFECK